MLTDPPSVLKISPLDAAILANNLFTEPSLLIR